MDTPTSSGEGARIRASHLSLQEPYVSWHAHFVADVEQSVCAGQAQEEDQVSGERLAFGGVAA